MIKKTRTFRFFGSLSLCFCYIASNRASVVIDIGSKIWDRIGGAFILKEARGKICNTKGEDWQIDDLTIIGGHENTIEKILQLI